MQSICNFLTNQELVALAHAGGKRFTPSMTKIAPDNGAPTAKEWADASSRLFADPESAKIYDAAPESVRFDVDYVADCLCVEYGFLPTIRMANNGAECALGYAVEFEIIGEEFHYVL